MKGNKDDSLFFIRDKTKIMISFSKQDLERRNTKEELDMYLVKAYLRFHCTVSGKVCLTLNAVTLGCGSPINGHSKEANEKFRNALVWLQENKYIYCSKDINTVKNTEYFEATILQDSMFHCNTNFVLLSMDEYEKIINSPTTSKKNVLLATYLYIKKGIYHNDSMPLPKLVVTSHSNIKNILGVSSVTTVKTALADLNNINLLFWDDKQYFYHDRKKHVYKPAKNVYALSEADLQYTKDVLADVYQTDIRLRHEIDNNNITYDD